MSLGTILVILLIIFLLGGFSGRFGGYGYGFGHGGVGILGVILIIVVVLHAAWANLILINAAKSDEPSSRAPREPPRRSHRVVESRGARSERRHRLDRKPDRRRCRSGGDAERCLDRRRRRTGGRRHVDGRRRIRVGQFAIRHRTGGPRARTQGVERECRVRA